MSFEEYGFAGLVAVLFLQVVKYVWRQWVVGDPEYDFHEGFYFVGIPVLAALVVPALAWLGVPGYEYPVDYAVWLKETFVLALTMIGEYLFAVKQLVVYRREMIAKRNA